MTQTQIEAQASRLAKAKKELDRLLLTVTPEEQARIMACIDAGIPTGYATVDRPWDEFYKNIIPKDTFLNTTPYTGLVKNNKDYPNETALRYFGGKVTFGGLLKNIENVSKSLEEYHVKEGDYITVCSTTTPEIVSLFYAATKIGAAANLMSPFYEPDELMGRVNDCESNLILMVDKFMPKFKDTLNREKDKNIIVLPMMNSSPLKYISKQYKVDGRTNETSWNTFMKDGSKRELAKTVDYDGKRPVVMVYSSGTTGASKGIVLTVDSFQKLINAYGNSGFDTSRGQKVYQNIPPWHSTGISLGINFPLSFGVEVDMDPRFDTKVFVDNVCKFKPEYILTNTSMYQGFTEPKNQKKLKRTDVSKFLKYPVEGGEPLTETDIRNIEAIIKTRLLNGYGQCECGATVTTDITSHKFDNKASGIPLPDITTIGIFDDNFHELKYGQRGNIMVKTDIGMLGYHKRPEANEKFFYVDSNGEKWSQTGDIGYINPDGSLVVLGRKGDYSIINGEFIYNFDIEVAVLQSKYVKLCEIQTHPQNDNKLVCHIVWNNFVLDMLKRDPSILNGLLTDIQSKVNEALGPNAIPYNFCIRDSFPSAHSGKRDWKKIKANVNDLKTVNEPKTKKLV
ncbi:MAG: acyl--CoA ligase [Bacilli bacterium]|nr:acyl--CoA ligase [Bacilli bacterium]